VDLTSHPALALALLFVLAVAAGRFATAATPRPRAIGARARDAAALAILAAFAALVAWYWAQPAYFDHAEPTIPAVSAVFSAGRPLYPAIEAPERYAHIYGPVLFLVHAAAQWLLGASIATSKAPGALAILGSLAACYGLYRRNAGASAALAATAACALVFSAFGNAAYWTRSDPLLVGCVVAGLAAVRLKDSRAAGVALGVSAGIALDLKFTGPLYFLPVLAMAFASHGWRAVLVAALVAAPVAAAPFLLPGVSFENYLDYVELSAGNGLVPAKVRQNIEWAVFMAAPVIAVAVRGRRDLDAVRGLRTCLVATAAALGLVAVAAAKPGGGPLHLLPFVPVLAFAYIRAGGAGPAVPARALTAAFACVTLLIAIPDQLLVVRTVSGRNLQVAITDIHAFAGGHPGRRIAVGYAGTSYLSHARVEAVFLTRDYLLDAPAVQEHQLSGLPLPGSTLHAIDRCRVEYWLIPRGGDPFVVPSAYAPNGPPQVFPDRFIETFRARHVAAGRAGAFDVWECRSRDRAGS
jgi:hypothetical protein